MASLFEAGYFQTLDLSSEHQVTIQDQLYGRHSITEPVLVELLRSAPLARLAGVNQHGISGLLGITPRVTRMEHSIGAFLLVRSVGGGVEEQVAALLHDISHTAMSHVVDFALSEPGEGSFHEVHKMRYVQTTDIPDILTRHGFADLRPLEEELYPLVEQPAPHLCADRLDYGLRDAVGFGNLSLEDAKRVISTLSAQPSSTSPKRLLVLQDPELALVLARAYMACDRDVWGNTAHGDLYIRTAMLMRTLIRNGSVREEELWTLSDDDFWARMRQAADADGQKAMDRLETEGLPDEKGLPLPRSAKVRTLDPDIALASTDQPLPLSVVLPEYATEKQEYIRVRQALYAPA
jgi:HD superfamily phosphohydrolase